MADEKHLEYALSIHITRNSYAEAEKAIKGIVDDINSRLGSVSADYHETIDHGSKAADVYRGKRKVAYLVIYRNDDNTYVMATRRQFPDRTEALVYADSIAAGRETIVVECDMDQSQPATRDDYSAEIATSDGMLIGVSGGRYGTPEEPHCLVQIADAEEQVKAHVYLNIAQVGALAYAMHGYLVARPQHT